MRPRISTTAHMDRAISSTLAMILAVFVAVMLMFLTFTDDAITDCNGRRDAEI